MHNISVDWFGFIGSIHPGLLRMPCKSWLVFDHGPQLARPARAASRDDTTLGGGFGGQSFRCQRQLPLIDRLSDFYHLPESIIALDVEYND